MDSSYKAQRKRNLYSPEDKKPYKISRSKIEAFVKCPRCFYIDRRLGTGQPPSFPYTLNNAVDFLLKKEFDYYRTEEKPHPLLVQYGIEAVPFQHDELNNWRMNQRGIQHLHLPTSLLVAGAIDDLWINSEGEIYVVDYKATSTQKEVSLDERDSYKRQMEVYQWLLRGSGFTVSNTSYFVYCNGNTDHHSFTGRLNFTISLLPYKGDDSWVENTLYDIKKCLDSNIIPEFSSSCDYCGYTKALREHTG